MALITCPECHGTVSDQAPTCPYCGYPINCNSDPVVNYIEERRNRKINTCLLIIVGVIFCIAVISVLVVIYYTYIRLNAV